MPGDSVMKKVFFVIICFLLIGCRAPQADSAPVIEFIKIPPADEGGPDKVETIEGRVTNARPGQRIVLFARSGAWWLQPLADQPFTEIQPDSTWKNTTHLGTDYAAMLVESDYHPPLKTDSLPNIGNGIVAVKTVKGGESVQSVAKTLQFSGYEWKIRGAASERGGKINLYDPANAWTDEKGFLHLRISRKNDQWHCAEIALTRSLGYGSYNFVVRDISNLEPAAVFSIFSWDDFEAGQNHREMDIEMTRWGDPSNKNLQYVVQPYYIPANVAQFTAPAGVLTHSIRWEPGRAEFKTFRGTKIGDKTALAAEHVFTSGVPASEAESVHIILYVFGYSKVPLEKETEVIIEKFEYLP